jgi:hypothetical protein
MIFIRQYAIDPKLATDNVRVEYSYNVFDAIANEDIGRGGIAHLTDGTGSLSDPKWGNDELCAALAALLNVSASDVSIATPD